MSVKDTPRTFRCACGRTLGEFARDRRGPMRLTPSAEATLVQVTGGVLWFRCACGVETPWFVARGRDIAPQNPGTLQC